MATPYGARGREAIHRSRWSSLVEIIEGASVRRTILLFAFFGLFACAMTSAQTRPSALLTVSQALDWWVINTEKHLVPVAEAMPEEKYSFAPSAGEFKGVRTFAQQVKHLAANNYAMAAFIRGEKLSPEMKNERGPDAVKSKAEIIEYLRGSFATLHEAVGTINDKNLTEPLNTGMSQNTRPQLVIDAVAHSFNHYGQLVEYLRMNGIVPPDSRPQTAR